MSLGRIREPTEGGLREPNAVGGRSSAFEKIAVLDLDLDPFSYAHMDRLTTVLPIAAFHAAAELLREKKPYAPAGYAVAVLSAWHREGRYA